MRVIFELDKDEIYQKIALISETFRLGSRLTETGRGKRLFKEMIPEDRQDIAHKLIHRYRTFSGDKIQLTVEEITITELLVNYCLALTR